MKHVLKIYLASHRLLAQAVLLWLVFWDCSVYQAPGSSPSAQCMFLWFMPLKRTSKTGVNTTTLQRGDLPPELQ